MRDDKLNEPPIGGLDRGPLAESGRVEAFSDGVLAIAITLLVLDLKVLEGEPGAVTGQLAARWPAYVAYLASFLYFGVIWVNHHALFRRIRLVDGGVLWRNMALLLVASVLPFPTATRASAMQHGTRGDQLAALALYGLVAATMGGTWLALFAHLARHRELLHDDVPAGFFRAERRRATLGIVSPLIAVPLGLVAPALALLAFLLLPIFYGLTTESWGPRRRE